MTVLGVLRAVRESATTRLGRPLLWAYLALLIVGAAIVALSELVAIVL